MGTIDAAIVRGLPRAGAALPLRDELAIPGLDLPLRLVLAGSADAPYFCALAGATDATDATGTPLYQRAAMAWLQARGQAATANGGRIVFDSPLAWSRAQVLQADSGGSSNGVTRIAVDATVAMHKVYRQLSAHNHEPAATRALDGAAGALRWLGDYRYHRPDGAVFALGLMTGYVEGEGLYAPLSRDLRALWGQAAREPAAQLLGTLAGWRAFLESLHAALRVRFAPGTPPPFALDAWRGEMRARLDWLAPRVLDDAALEPARAQVLSRLMARLDRVAARATAPPAGVCHGDLHLSHLLREAAGTRRVIDLSPPALDPAAPAFATSSPLSDWVALERALDYVFLDEAALALSSQCGLPQEHTIARLHAPAALGAPAARRLAAGLRWHAAVRTALCGPHLAHPAWAPLYLGRLLQELEYNYRHARPYYRSIDWFFLERHFSHLTGA